MGRRPRRAPGDPATIRHQNIILSAVFTTALNDFVIRLHPCRGVKTPTVPVKSFRILDPNEVARLLLALPNDASRLLVDTFIGTGLRWGDRLFSAPRDGPRQPPSDRRATLTTAATEKPRTESPWVSQRL